MGIGNGGSTSFPVVPNCVWLVSQSGSLPYFRRHWDTNLHVYRVEHRTLRWSLPAVILDFKVPFRSYHSHRRSILKTRLIHSPLRHPSHTSCPRSSLVCGFTPRNLGIIRRAKCKRSVKCLKFRKSDS